MIYPKGGKSKWLTEVTDELAQPLTVLQPTETIRMLPSQEHSRMHRAGQPVQISVHDITKDLVIASADFGAWKDAMHEKLTQFAMPREHMIGKITYGKLYELMARQSSEHSRRSSFEEIIYRDFRTPEMPNFHILLGQTSADNLYLVNREAVEVNIKSHSGADLKFNVDLLVLRLRGSGRRATLDDVLTHWPSFWDKSDYDALKASKLGKYMGSSTPAHVRWHGYAKSQRGDVPSVVIPFLVEVSKELWKSVLPPEKKSEDNGEE